VSSLNQKHSGTRASLDRPLAQRQRIAVIGGGISGLSTAYLLASQHDVTVFEAAPRLGGHARTVMAGMNGDQPVDTGFIVFNYINYPNLTRMFLDLDVPVIKSDMSFGASIDDGRVEYGLQGMRALTAQMRNLTRPGFARMIRDIMRFNAKAEANAQDDLTTIGELMDELNLGEWFQRCYLMPLCGAIWSTSPSEIRKFPARALVQFFRNHALLSATGQHQWWTVEGGSIAYVSKLEAHLKSQGVRICKSTSIRMVKRNKGEISILSEQDTFAGFHQVVFACHSDQALQMLEHPTPEEHSALSAIQFQDNNVILHRDTTQMPKRRAVWASWVYKADTRKEEPSIGVTYWMNRLQQIPESDPLFVSLNPAQPVQEKLIYDQTTFRHPVFDRAALAAQTQLTAMQGQNNTWFAGAYTRHGFHEDGFASAMRIARLMGQKTA